MRPLAAPLAGAAAAAMLMLAGCSRSAPEPEPESTEIPEELAGEAPRALAEEGIGTPMDERLATLGLLNKRNNITREIELKPGESRRVGDVIVRLSACERTPPWEEPPETGAFVQVLVLDRPEANAQGDWRRVFSGWLFRNSPGLNVVEHPIYDVWVKDCTMSFPGEEAGAAVPAAPTAAPAPRPSPSPAEPATTSNEA